MKIPLVWRVAAAISNMEERAAVVERLDAGANIAEIAREFKTTRQTIMRVKEAALKLPSQQKE